MRNENHKDIPLVLNNPSLRQNLAFIAKQNESLGVSLRGLPTWRTHTG